MALANKEHSKADDKGGKTSEVIADQSEVAAVVNHQMNTITGDQPVQKITSPNPSRVLPPTKPNIGAGSAI